MLSRRSALAVFKHRMIECVDAVMSSLCSMVAVVVGLQRLKAMAVGLRFGRRSGGLEIQRPMAARRLTMAMLMLFVLPMFCVTLGTCRVTVSPRYEDPAV